jgi:hypothetical protein
MKLRVGQRYLASDRKGQPTCYFTATHIRELRLWYKMLREGVVTITTA